MRPLSAWMYRYKICCLLCVISLLSACSAPKPKIQLPEPDWEVSGKIGVRENMLRATSSLFSWKQQEQHYVIHVFTSLGQPQFTLFGNASFAQLQTAEGDVRSAATAEELLEQITGWSFPVSATRLWLEGKLQGSETALQYDEAGQLTAFQLDNWQVNLNHYKPVGNSEYPHKITLHNDHLKLTIIIKDYVHA